MSWQLIFLLVLLIPLLAIVLDSQVGKAVAARLEKGGDDGAGKQLLDRIQHLEGEIDRLSTEVERLEEESAFLHKLLVDRAPADEAGERTLPPGADQD